MYDLYIDVSVYGGASIPSAIRQIADLANRLQIDAWATLNGVRTLVRPGDNPAETIKAWESSKTGDRASAPSSRSRLEREHE